GVLVLDPNLGFPVEDREDFLDRVQVGGRTLAGITPLLEHAKLRGASDGRHLHTGDDAGPPLFARLTTVIDDAHGRHLPMLAPHSAAGPQAGGRPKAGWGEMVKPCTARRWRRGRHR